MKKYHKIIKEYRYLNNVPEKYITKDFCVFCVSTDIHNLSYVKKEYLDYDFYLNLVDKKGDYLRNYVPCEYLKEELLNKAFKNNPECLKVFPEDKITYKMCLIAAKHNGVCLGFIPEKYKTKNICLTSLIKSNAEILVYCVNKLPKKYVSFFIFSKIFKSLENAPVYYIGMELLAIAIHNNTYLKLIKSNSYYYF
jgi:hypothetical protein